ncbi:MAG: pilus assembly PilX N-terminal domain-containing protein [Clostridia bacterium]|nr:pilus assembly PilX N-terminal domain-containing protein [Clostridia bacterium]
MNKYLKNKEGMALPMVLIIMMVLTILAAGLGTYASQSLRSVRYMDAQKQAYYLSRAGVEAGAFAYQNATTKTSSNYDNNDSFANGLVNFTNIDKFVAVIENSHEKVTTNKVYLVYDSSAANAGTMWDGLKFTTFSDEEAARFMSDDEERASRGVIGYFSLEVAGGQQEVLVNDNGTEKVVPKDVVEFRSTAVCFNDYNGTVTRVSSGYVYPAQTVSSETCYGADGYLSTNKGDFDNSDTKTVTYDENQFNTKTGNFWNRLKNGLLKLAFNIMKSSGLIPAQENITVYEMIGAGDLILARPSDDVGTIKINDNMNNFYIFSTSGSLILEDCGLQVDPTKGKYATIGLYGSDIVVDGDITMGVYHTNTSGFFSGLGTLVATLGNRYRLGTVMIGNGLESGGQWAEYLTYNEGGITDQSGKTVTNGSRIFFNGNVNVKVYSQGAATETYRVFSAGDICLFNGVYEVSNQNVNSTEEVATRGIDLLKYFLDAVIAEEEGFRYGDAAIKKMTQIRDLYYGDPADKQSPGEPSYFIDGQRPLRKLNVNLGASSVSIDNKLLTYRVGGRELIEYIQQPTPTQSTNITWGKPTTSYLTD